LRSNIRGIKLGSSSSMKSGKQTLAELTQQQRERGWETVFFKKWQNKGFRSGKRFWAPYGLALGPTVKVMPLNIRSRNVDLTIFILKIPFVFNGYFI